MATTTTTRRRIRLITSGIPPLVLLAFFIFLCVAGPAIWGAAAGHTDVAHASQGSSAQHWMGTDALGRDILARTLLATSRSLVLAVLSTLIGGCVGVALGLIAGMSRRLGRLIGAVIALLIAFPAMLLAIFFAVIFGIGSVGSVLAVGAAFAPGFARLTQTLTASTATREYVEAAHVLGKGPVRVVFRHILPNIAEPLILYSTIHIGTAILSLAGLSFLGLGVQPPAYDWGRMLSDGLASVYTTPGGAIAPAIAIVLAGLTFNMLGEWISDLIGGRNEAPRTVSAAPAELPADTVGAAELSAGHDRLLEVSHLRVVYGSRDGVSTPVRDVSFTVNAGETVAIVGESGSGKSQATAAVAQLVEAPGSVYAKQLEFLDTELLEAGKNADELLGRSLAMIFQDPGEALNPAVTIGTHLLEPAMIHLHEPKRSARERAIEALRAVAINDPARRYKQHPHELSGGMKQRVCIAIGLMGEPRLLIADEPTTALDVTVQRQILRLISRVGKETHSSILFISHDIAVVSEISDRILVMYAGFIVEEAPTAALLETPAHPYTALLVASSPTMSIDKEAPLPSLDGTMPRADQELAGCYFADRCPRADARCRSERPPLEPVGDTSHRAACWHPLIAGEKLPVRLKEPEEVLS
ncbi:dipeptide/oligopeptide/nickel ABC transporter permease/ATP-binding protein [Gryllotalpicola protaetiae]|uniref:ATP-binding cassette domain-containing protein n=1 Tax=Gryllotalpicola protaetiae TaxID=2419771 RepID=A0A387BW21_9MICO|nr:dipeptide/oligopeptide/nickel ABC transporter permease/ATP-binding protein [Gryllotalpicola protaetiae]AYG05340.1 ATP-binding cassette domain-containing protein [Gryllotalpicola protaetiae]